MVLRALRMIPVLFHPGDTWLHRLKPAQKLIALAVFGAALMLATQWFVLAVALVLPLFLLFQTGVSSRQVFLQVRPMLWLVAVLAALTAWVQTPEAAMVLVLRISTLLLAALVVTMTTTVSAMMDVVVWLLRPLERLGWVRAERVALAFGLTLRLIPELSLQWSEIREAQAARGLKISPLTMALPMLLRTLRRAHEIAEAIDARESAESRSPTKKTSTKNL
jgi:biotin transport system permease protein